MRNSIYLLVYGRRFQKSSSSKQNCWPVKPKMLKVIPIPNIVMLDTLFRMKIGLNECLVIHTVGISVLKLSAVSVDFYQICTD